MAKDLLDKHGLRKSYDCTITNTISIHGSDERVKMVLLLKTKLKQTRQYMNVILTGPYN